MDSLRYWVEVCHVDGFRFDMAPGTDASAALDTTAISAYAQKHTRIFYIVGRVSGNKAAAQVSQAEAWMDSHYHLLGQVKSAGNITVRLYEVSQGA
jgi:pullulanase/glycogen debranching enzyme